jgi:hypothetical protein
MAERLQGIGVAILMALADPALRPPKPERGIPGLRCSEPVVTGTQVHVEAVGYGSWRESDDALEAAIGILTDAGLDASRMFVNVVHPTIVVRRR